MQKFVLSWQDAADWQWQEACRREAVIRPLAEQDPVSRQEAVAAAKQLGISPRLVYRLVARFRRRPQTSSLVPGVRGRAARSRSLDPRVEALVASAIKEVYLRPERPRLIDLWRAVRAQCLPLGLKPPAYHTLQARVQQWDARVVLQARAERPPPANATTGSSPRRSSRVGPWKSCRSTTRPLTCSLSTNGSVSRWVGLG